MFNTLVQLTGGAISKVVADSSAKVKELPVAKPNDALEQFNAEYGNAISSFETFTTFDAHGQSASASNAGGKQQKILVNVLWRTFWQDVLKAAVLKAMWGGFVIFSVAFFVFRQLAYIRFKANDKDHTPEEKQEGY